MITTYVEYDVNGEIFHVCQIETTEGNIQPPPFDASEEEKLAHAERVQAAIAYRAAETKKELEAHRASGKRLLVVPDGAEKPEHGRHTVNHATGKIVKRNADQYAAWLAAQDQGATPVTPPNRP